MLKPVLCRILQDSFHSDKLATGQIVLASLFASVDRIHVAEHVNDLNDLESIVHRGGQQHG